MPSTPLDLESLVRSASGPCVAFDPNFTILAANEAYLRVTRATREVVGRNVFEVLPPNPAAIGSDGPLALRVSLQHVLETRSADRQPITRYDIPRPMADGGGFEERYWEALSYPVFGPDGAVVAILHQVEDVTELVRLRRSDAMLAAELAEARNVYQAIYDQGLFAGRIDLDGIVTDANRSSLEQCGYTLADVIGKPFWECGWWNRSPGVQAWVKSAVAQALRGEPFRGESPYFWADGTERVVEFACMPVKDDFGRVQFVVPTGMDITERAQAERDHRAADILESITDAFFAVDRAWRFTYVNRQAERILGRSPDDLLGRVLSEEFPGLHGSAFEAAYRRTMNQREAVALTSFYPDHDRWYEIHAYPAADGISVYFRDVTERKRTEDEMARLIGESEHQRRVYEAALSNTPDLVYVFDLDHRFLYANEALLRMWGRSREEALGKNCLELGYEPWHAAMHDREIEQVVATRAPIRGEVPFTGTNGRRIYDYIFVPVIGADGSVVAVAGTTRDVTDRRQADEALRRSEERFRLAQQAANVGTYDWNLATNEVSWSEGIYRSLGLEPGSVEPSLDLWNRLVHPDDLESAYGAVQAAFRSGETYYHEFRVVRPTGEVRWLVSTGRVVAREDGAPVRFLGVNLDITDRKVAEMAAREHEARFRQIADNLPGGAIYQAVPGPNGGTHFTYISRGVERLFGYTEAEILAEPDLLFGLVLGEDAPMVRAANEVAASNRAPFDLQFRIRARDGTVKWVHARSAPRITAKGGRVWDGVVLDISAQKQAEQRQYLLAEAGRILASSLDYETTLSAVCRLAVPVLADWCSLELLTESGAVRRVEVAHSDPDRVALAHDYRERYPPDPNDERGLMRVLRTGEPEVFEEIPDDLLRLGARDEEHYRILSGLGLRSVIIVPLIARGRTLGALSLVTAESSRRYGPEDLHIAQELAARSAIAVDNARLLREAEAAAREREEALALHQAVEEQLTLLVQASGSLSASLEPTSVLDAVVSLSRRLIAADAYAIWRFDPTCGRWGITNSSGLSEAFRDNAIDHRNPTPLLTEDPVKAEDVRALPLLENRRAVLEQEGVKSLLVVPLKVRGKIDGTLTFYYRSPHRFSEVEIRVATALSNLASSAIGTSELYAALRENDRKKDEFLAMLAHELRNPLSAIGNAVQVVRRSTALEHLEWAKEIIAKHVKALSRMIDDLLDVSRITRGKIELQKQLLDVLPIVAQAVETVRPLVEDRRHELIISHSSAPMWVEADPHRLEQVIVNLLNNAAKYTESGGKIVVSTMPDGDDVAIVVTDNGRGIPPEKIPEMFELFAQGDRSIARSEGGLGIGLTIVRSLVEMHGGTVSATSQGPDLGSAFTVRLPSSLPPAPSVAVPSRVEPDRALRRTRVLVVDDNADNAHGLVNLFRILGHDVVTASDGPAALEAARLHRPDYILLDIGLPGMDGYQVARRLRDEGFRETVIIAVSGYGEEAARRRASEAGFDHHLVKPIDHDDLLALLRGDPDPQTAAG